MDSTAGRHCLRYAAVHLPRAQELISLIAHNLQVNQLVNLVGHDHGLPAVIAACHDDYEFGKG